MNVNDIFPSKYVKAHDLGGKNVTVTIRTATMEELGHGSEKERKLVIWFEKATKGLVTNRTNAMIIAGMYGPETDGWKGKQITIYSARVKAFGAVHDAVRVKEQKPTGSTGAPMPPAMNEPPPVEDDEELLDVDEGNVERIVDTETGEIMDGADNPFEDTPVEAPPRTHESPPHQRLFGQGASAFGQADWNGGARAWLIEKYTEKATPNNVRISATELSDDEKDMLSDYIKEHLTTLQRLWKHHKAAMQQSTGEKVAVQ